ncbi:hypothetical protein LSTR_LSTR009617 [Laodelphax striatellus]|uniref:Trehalose-6-phosphate synthase n=1 Tax=Laodelphax striatellus TaxID=195883 RepID=A0A482WJL5_LAOST|nr:hypothetical protein LSTR_LSTR009617 [Laodelphax striatellus]
MIENIDSDGIAGGKIIVVSNRLPFVLKRDSSGNLSRHASAGGLVTAVAPVVVRNKGIWIGWPGIQLENPEELIPESDPNDKTPTAGLLSSQVVAVQVEPQQFDSYYNGCCNRTFWPLFHSMPDRAVFSADHWKVHTLFRKTLFAYDLIFCSHMIIRNDYCSIYKMRGIFLLIFECYCEDTIELVKQYKNVCDEMNLKCKIGFFLHIPFPPWDIFRLFPWADEVLQGMLGCDMVGFHIEDYCLNFVDCCQRRLGCRVDRKGLLVEHGGRSVRVRPLPIGIPYERFVQLAESAPAVLATSQQVVLGVDRLDYTKGLVHRLRAFEILLEKYPQHLEKISVPSRTDVKRIPGPEKRKWTS